MTKQSKITLIAELDETNHILRLRRRMKIGQTTPHIIELVFANIALTAQAETLIKRSIEGTEKDLSDSDCWLLATGTEFSDPAFDCVREGKEKDYIKL